MSILSQLLEGKITWAQAVVQIESTFARITSGAPAAMQPIIKDGESALKQAASNAIAMADTMFDVAIGPAAATVSATAVSALSAYAGPIGGAMAPAIRDGIMNGAAHLKAEIDAAAAQVIANFTPPPATPAQGVAPVRQPPPT